MKAYLCKLPVVNRTGKTEHVDKRMNEPVRLSYWSVTALVSVDRRLHE